MLYYCVLFCFFFFKQKTAYEMRISDWSSDVCSSDLNGLLSLQRRAGKPDLRRGSRSSASDSGKPRSAREMTEHTDKSPQKPGRTPPRKRAGKARSPDGKRAMRPNDKLAGEKAAAPALPTTGPDGAPEARGEARGNVRGDAHGLAPDPATIVFGTMRPIAAAPAKLPESSGLHFSEIGRAHV